jgi:hypothetical protein
MRLSTADALSHRHDRDSSWLLGRERLDSCSLVGEGEDRWSAVFELGTSRGCRRSQLRLRQRIDRAAFFVPTAKEVAVGYGC